jgi:chitinase
MLGLGLALGCGKASPGDTLDSGSEDASADTATPDGATPDAEAPDDGVPDADLDGPPPDAGGCDATSTPDGRVVAYVPLSLRSSYDYTSIDYSIVTHVVEHAVCTNGNGTLNLTNLGETFPVPNLVSDAHAGGAKAILGLCGDPGPTDAFSEMASGATSRAAFIMNVMSVIEEYDFDGVDIDWEYPSSASDESKLTKLVTEMRAAMGTTLSISIAGPNNDGIAQYFDVPSLLPMLDWFTIQTYDYSDPKTSATSYHDAPLYSIGNKGSVDDSVQYYLKHGATSAKLLIGLPFYGKQYDGADALNQHLTNHKGMSTVEYSAVVPLIGAGWTVHREIDQAVPYLLRTDSTPGVVVYDDPMSIQAKCSYVACAGLGGAILWSIGQDVIGSSQPLMEAAKTCR